MRHLAIAATIAALVASASGAQAQHDPHAKQAEAAYREVDFARTRELAKMALEAGNNTVRQTERLYFLLGMASATLGEENEAREAFTALLAINPKARLEKNLSPKLRGSYSEALGFWNSTSERLGANVGLNDSGNELVIEISDPTEMVSGASIQSRGPTRRFSKLVREVVKGEPMVVALPQKAPPIEFIVTLLDEYGNALKALGSTAKPLRFERSKERDWGVARATQPPESKGSAGRWIGGVAVALGAVGVGAAIPFHLDREEQASTWNGNACEAPVGLTRGEQCSAINSEVEKNEQRMLILYGAGGALLTGGIVTLLLSGPPSERPSEVGLTCGPGLAALFCRGRF